MRVYCNFVDNILNVDSSNFSLADVVVFGFNFIGKVNYKNELAGSQDNLLKLSKISKNSQKIIIGGAYTDNYGVIRKSALISEKGKILGICDMHLKRHDLAVSIGYGYKIYQTKSGKIGVLIDDDLLNYEAIKCMTMCDADVIVVISDNKDKFKLDYLLRSYSFLFGIPIILVTQQGVIVTDIKGEIIHKSEQNEIDVFVSVKKNFTILTTKQRGLN